MKFSDPLVDLFHDIGIAFHEMSSTELADFAPHWQALTDYLQQPNHLQAHMMDLLRQAIVASPTLVRHKFNVVAADMQPRYGVNPVAPAKQTQTSGMAPVRNEVVEQVYQLNITLKQRLR